MVVNNTTTLDKDKAFNILFKIDGVSKSGTTTSIFVFSFSSKDSLLQSYMFPRLTHTFKL